MEGKQEELSVLVIASDSVQPTSTNSTTTSSSLNHDLSSSEDLSKKEENRRTKKFYDNQTTYFMNEQSRAFTTRIAPAVVLESKKKDKSDKRDFAREAKKMQSKPINENSKKIIKAPSLKEDDHGLEFVTEEELSRVKQLAQDKYQLDLDQLFQYETNQDSNNVELMERLKLNHIDDISLLLDILIPPIYATQLIEFGRDNLPLILQWEYIMDKLLLSDEDEAQFIFPPGKKKLRHLEHNITDYYRILSRGVDPEPLRRVAVLRKKSEARRPLVLLSEVLTNSARYQQLQQLLKDRIDKLTQEEELKRIEKIKRILGDKFNGAPIEECDSNGFKLVISKKRYEGKPNRSKAKGQPVLTGQTEAATTEPISPKPSTSNSEEKPQNQNLNSYEILKA
ncbi:predicted protein [Naegleria gruberi]|uniref:Predicted protein n=1 Tax=Naegleria gruberi TaxID=5762 RepID=D2VUX2_NAEGR|nr:uncharacterized protein NAEGRDRAFT_72816 [Naegleria gruberi]EFC39341.1 predicted protein [Naegleria gruberi]|eukprot:XP_002672085.1 predicted protein [Naegleria gruberi strain NEG-M]